MLFNWIDCVLSDRSVVGLYVPTFVRSPARVVVVRASMVHVS